VDGGGAGAWRGRCRSGEEVDAMVSLWESLRDALRQTKPDGGSRVEVDPQRITGRVGLAKENPGKFWACRMGLCVHLFFLRPCVHLCLSTFF
jgi:hypothetical protein